MKANEAPDNIYISPNTEESTYYVSNQYNRLIEYIRTDAFIEKAEKYLKSQFIKDVSVLAGGAVIINFSVAIENFVKYMKGE